MSKRYTGNKLVIGTTGSGKSRFLLSLLKQDIDQWKRTKHGLLLLDPHGELCDRLLAQLAEPHELGVLPFKKKGSHHE